MDYMQLNRPARTASPSSHPLSSVYKSDRGSPISGMTQNNHGVLTAGSHDQILDVPLPPPASYNQGYTPDDHCLKQQQNMFHTIDCRPNQQKMMNNMKDGGGGGRRQVSYNEQRNNQEALPHSLHAQLRRLDSYKHPTNQQFQGVDNCSNKNMKPLDVRSTCPSSMSCTLPRQGLTYQVDPLRGCQPLPHGQCGPLEHRINSPNLSMGPSHPLHVPADIQPPLQYGTLGRVKPRNNEVPSKIRRELRASASDLSDPPKNFTASDKNVQGRAE